MKNARAYVAAPEQLVVVNQTGNDLRLDLMPLP